MEILTVRDLVVTFHTAEAARDAAEFAPDAVQRYQDDRTVLITPCVREGKTYTALQLMEILAGWRSDDMPFARDFAKGAIERVYLKPYARS